MSTRLILSQRVFEMIKADCRRYKGVETGGILVGRKVGPDFVVVFVVPGGPKAERAKTGFAPDSTWQQEVLDVVFDRFDASVDYLGDYHKHPSRFDRPSAHDFRTAREIVSSPAWDKPEAVFPITTIRRGRVLIRAYLMRREGEDFEELPVVIVPDRDRRIRRLLLTEPPKRKENPRHACVSCGCERSSRLRGLFRLRPAVRSGQAL